MPLRDREIDRIEEIVADRPYWSGGGSVFRALGIGEDWRIGRRGNGRFRDHVRQLGDAHTEALLS